MAIIPSISSVAFGLCVAGSILSPSISFLHSAIKRSEISDAGTPSSFAFLIILSSTSVKLET